MSAAHIRIRMGSHHGRTLDVEVHQDVLATLEPGQDFDFQRPVLLPKDDGVFQEVAALHSPPKILLGQKLL